jgi:hypothetical protein
MERIKWFEVHWSSNYENVSKNIIANKFSDNKQYGFKVYKRRDDHINASYIEIKEIEEEVENPLTNELTVYKRVLFDKNDFIIENNIFGIELINPSRTSQHLINTIASLSNFNITIKPFNYNLSKLIQILKLKLENLTINQIECSEIKIKGHTSGKLTAKNNQNDLFSDIEEFLHNREYTIEKVKCSFSNNSQFVNFELSNHGSLKAKKTVLEFISPIIKESILEIK